MDSKQLEISLGTDASGNLEFAKRVEKQQKNTLGYTIAQTRRRQKALSKNVKCGSQI